jgi:hypothetical protein
MSIPGASHPGVRPSRANACVWLPSPAPAMSGAGMTVTAR